MKTQGEVIASVAYQGAYLTQVLTDIPVDVVGKVDVTIVKHSEKRSLDANGYYWKLVELISKARNLSKTRVHNMLLRDYGTLFRSGEYLVQVTLPDTEAAYEQFLNETDYHVYPTSETWEDEGGHPFRTYYVIKGSRYYNTEEMSRLIEGAVSEAQENGIQTATPDEIARMEELYDEAKKGKTA